VRPRTRAAYAEHTSVSRPCVGTCLWSTPMRC
jgi:hypothetical protein